ncbi:hypothetical protein L1987_72715 [Smallanthus sonchifolius]|uniref:Uncharacterized protein n=1 Tax=Smallanthus sonchifolius TaxID=185202 RepID=A0ACB9AW00_9ASTR|nr:hypothetical protein L1987_72715 [Smallanthus sonchifolius]
MMCYVGKATKIFIFIVAVIVVTGLVVGLSILGRNIHPKSHKCSGDECSISDSDYSPPPPFQIPFPSLPNYNPSDPTASSTSPPPPPPETYLSPPAPPETSLSPPETSLPQPPPPETSLTPPPSTSLDNPSPPPPIPVSVVTPPAAVTAAPPPAVEVSPGPMNSS